MKFPYKVQSVSLPCAVDRYELIDLFKMLEPNQQAAIARISMYPLCDLNTTAEGKWIRRVSKRLHDADVPPLTNEQIAALSKWRDERIHRRTEYFFRFSHTMAPRNFDFFGNCWRNRGNPNRVLAKWMFAKGAVTMKIYNDREQAERNDKVQNQMGRAYLLPWDKDTLLMYNMKGLGSKTQLTLVQKFFGFTRTEDVYIYTDAIAEDSYTDGICYALSNKPIEQTRFYFERRQDETTPTQPVE